MRNLNFVLIALVTLLPSYGLSKESFTECSRDNPEICIKMALEAGDKRPVGHRDLKKAQMYSEIACDAGNALGCIVLSAALGEQFQFDEARKYATLGCVIGKTEKICSWQNVVDEFANKDREKYSGSK